MGIFSSLISAPLLPVKGTVWVAEQVRDEAERQYYDPATIRRALEEVGDAREAGTIGQEEADRMEKALVRRLLASTRRSTSKE
ncbi:gas vesicle protein [Brachybacterium endophyticum]|uniref:Gas vesicle protein n=1 Tax=Brachybacterium endophyticum TaxID=2182385 RepID=A0A2U2RKS7_9MICO|nr:gas vesicle protein GvpG [Brachybacterium endophyticum]PWH06470.1 gas vesicle protein [Brachybacterium endophyticum]